MLQMWRSVGISIFLTSCLTACLGGGAAPSGTKLSLGAAEFIGIELGTYDAVATNLMIKGRLIVPGVTEFNQIFIFTDSSCSLDKAGEGIHKDFYGAGIPIAVSSTAVTQIFVSTNTVSECFSLYTHLPRFDAPASPVFVATSPPLSSRTVYTPLVKGTVSSAVTTVQLYDDLLCTNQVGSGSAAVFASPGIQAQLLQETDSQIYAVALDAFGKRSDCAFLTNYLHDSTGPGIPTFTSITPVSPSGATLSPTIVGQVTADSTQISLYTDAACSTPIQTGTPTDFRSTGIQITVAPNSVTSIYGTSTDQYEMVSDCGFLTIFTHDSVAPSAPVYTAADPVSPTRTTLVPRIRGTTPADTMTVKFFSNASCTVQVGAGTKTTFEAAGIPATVQSNETSQIYAAAVDAAGNMSACTLMTSYIHDTLPPEPPGFVSTVPVSPNNSSITPFVQGTYDISTITVAIFNDDSCLNQIGSGSASTFETAGIQINVLGNTITTLYATATDEAGNVSPCGALSNYAHSTAPAPAPSFLATSPASPTRITNQPYIVGTAANTVTKVTLFRDSFCAATIGTASRSTFVSSGIQSTLAMNTETTIYAVSEDIYGNLSSCTFMSNFIHNTVPPFDPIYVSVTPLSPNNSSTQPIIKGTITFDPGNILAPSEVALFDSFLCINKIGTSTPADYELSGTAASVPANAPTSIYARVFDAAGNMSGCTFMTDYVHDGLTPGRPILTAIAPTTPSYTSRTLLTGSVGPSPDFLPATTLVIYSDLNCTTQITTGPTSTFVAGTYALDVAPNSTTTLYGANFNAVGTPSPCTALITYAHSDVAPAGLAALSNPDGSISLNWLSDTIANPMPTYIIRRSLLPSGPFTTIGEDINGATYTDSNVSNGATYYYVVAAKNITGTSKDSAPIATTVGVPVPAGLVGLTATPGPNQITLNWVGASENMEYRVLRSTQRGGPYSLVASGVISPSYVDRFLTNGTSYYYVVVGTNPAGQSVQSNEAQATPISVPSPPTGLTLSLLTSAPECAGAAGVLLTWTASPYFNNFVIHRSVTSTGGSPLQTTAATRFVDCAPLSNGPIYYNYYYVTAGWGTLQSGESNRVVFVHEGVGSLSVLPGNGHVNITWLAVPTASFYRLYRSTQSGGPYTLVDGTLTSPAYTDSAVANGQAYFYILNSEYPDDTATGWYSTEQSGTPGPLPSGPSNLTLTVNAVRTPVFTWSTSDAANSYRIYRAASAAGPYTLYGTALTANYADTTPASGMNFYRVTSMWGSTESAISNTVQFRHGYPSTIAATSGTSSIVLNWAGVAGALNYSVLRSTTSGGPYASVATVAGTTYTDSTVLINAGYFYVIQARFSDGTTGQYSNQTDGARTGSTIPGGLTVTATTQSSISLGWPRFSGASSYKVYRSNTLGGAYSQVDQVSATSSTISGLTGLAQHFFRYTFIKAGVESSPSSVVSAFTRVLPSPPLVTPGNNQVSLAWSTSTGATSYTVSRSTDGESFTDLVTGLTTPSYIDTTAANGVNYFYQLTAVYATEQRTSVSSAAVTPGIVPRTPAGLSLTRNITGTDVELSWGMVASVNSYRIYQSTSSGGPYTLASQVSSNVANPISLLTPGTRYYFVVAAVMGAIESAYSNEVSAIPTATPIAPTSIVNGSNIDVAWAAIGGAATYKVLRSTDQKNYSEIATGVVVPNFSDPTPVSGQNYDYKYLPVTAAGVDLAVSLASIPISFGVFPLAPLQLTAYSTTTTSASLGWVQSPNALEYGVYRATSTGGPYVLIGSASVTSYADSGLTPGTAYYYVVSARDSAGIYSPYSNEASVQLGSAPATLTANALNNLNDLAWTAVGGATSYQVYRGETSGGGYGLIASGLASTTYQDVAIENGVRYYYVVSAIVSGLPSPYSNEANAVGIKTMSLQVPIELVDQGLASDTGVTTFARTETSFDTVDYDGTVTYEFEGIVRNTDTLARDIELVDTLDAVVGTITIPPGTSAPTRLRTVFTPTLGASTYRVRLPATTSAAQVEVATARILVTQVNASRTRIYIPLLSSAAGAFISDESGPVENTNSAAYTTLNAATLYQKESAKYATLASQNPWTLEALVSTTGTAVGSIALYNQTRAAHVDDTETIFEGTTIKRVLSPFQDGVTGFGTANEGDLFRVALRCLDNCGTGTVRIFKAGLWVRLTSLEKARVIFRNSLGAMASSPTTLESQRNLMDLTKFTNPVTYFQATANFIMGTGPAALELSSAGLDDANTASLTKVLNSDLAFTDTAKSFVRSGVITLSSGNRYLPTIDPATSLLLLTDTSIVVDVSP